MKIIRTILIAIFGLISVVTSHAQLKFPVSNNDLRINLQKVIDDFPNSFSSLKGDTLIDNPQSIEFASMLEFVNARENSITQFKSAKPIYSWQANLMVTEEFEEASKKYKWLYNQLKVMTLNFESGYSFTLNGDYDEPMETKKFSSSIFKLTPNAGSMPKLKIEVGLQYEFPVWKVNLLVYEKEREDKERGDIYGD